MCDKNPSETHRILWTPLPLSPKHLPPEALSLRPRPGSSGVEQWIENPRVGGSIPPPGTIGHFFQ